MKLRLHFLCAIQTALESGMTGFALVLIELHDLHNPANLLRPAYDRMVLARLNSNRQLIEITP